MAISRVEIHQMSKLFLLFSLLAYEKASEKDHCLIQKNILRSQNLPPLLGTAKHTVVNCAVLSTEEISYSC